MPKPLDSGLLGKMEIKNRFVRSATWEGMADDDGSCLPPLVDLTRKLADGEIGLIISSHAFVSPEGQAGLRQVAVCDDKFLSGLTKMAEAAHEGGSKIVLQLAHAGVQALTSVTNVDAIGPSSVTNKHGVAGREMDRDEIERTIQAFIRAANRAKEAGFDGVQIHAAHGYLLSQFLSPRFNERTDEYGGTVENRARIVLTILKGIKASLGDDFPVLTKMNCDDFIERGLSL